MRFTVSSTTLSSRLNTLSKVINSKNSMPILNCFLFEITNGNLTVTASDTENLMRSTIDLDECDGEGSFCVNNTTILSAIKELAEQPVTFDIDPDTLRMSILYLNGVYNIVALSAEEYPRAIEMQGDEQEFTIESEVLANGVSRGLFATANDELRPVMKGIYFDLKPEAAYLAATDGHKLVRTTVPSITFEQETGFVLPKKPAILLKNVLKKDDSTVSVRFNARNAIFTFDEGELVCRLTEGRYPLYKSVIPNNNNNFVRVNRKFLIGTLRRVIPFANGSSQLVRFKIFPGKMEISSEDIDFSTSAKEIVACEYDGNNIVIGFKGSTPSEMLNNLDSEDITFELSDGARAGIVVPSPQAENSQVLMLMMPMLLND